MVKNKYILVFGTLLVALIFTGCSASKMTTDKSVEKRASSTLLSCQERANPKSLQYLEQQYRCSTQK